MNPYMMNMYNPYMMGMGGMYNPYMMMGMGPQNLEQYRNMQKLSTEMMTKQINFMGQINPFFNTSQNQRLGFQKDIMNYQSDLSSIYSPYSKENIGATKGLMNATMDYQQSMMMNPMMMNPFAFGMGCPTVI
jgi:hypothetical protein